MPQEIREQLLMREQQHVPCPTGDNCICHFTQALLVEVLELSNSIQQGFKQELAKFYLIHAGAS